jgi:superfamily I DNA/RNA helicase
MPDFNPTPEQRAIVEFAQDETANLAVIARAGAAKTSTLVLLAEALPDTKILCLAFNKKIAEEMTARLPSHCESRTLHSIGMRVWLDYIRKRPKVNGGKMRSMFKALVEKLSKEDQQAAWDMYKEIMDTIGAGKQAGWLPDDFVARSSYKSHIDDESFFAGLPMEPTQLHIDIVKRLSEDSFMLAVQGVSIDFDDMIMCPCCAQVSWPTYDPYSCG